MHRLRLHQTGSRLIRSMCMGEGNDMGVDIGTWIEAGEHIRGVNYLSLVCVNGFFESNWASSLMRRAINVSSRSIR